MRGTSDTYRCGSCGIVWGWSWRLLGLEESVPVPAGLSLGLRFAGGLEVLDRGGSHIWCLCGCLGSQKFLWTCAEHATCRPFADIKTPSSSFCATILLGARSNRKPEAAFGQCLSICSQLAIMQTGNTLIITLYVCIPEQLCGCDYEGK